MTGRFSHIVSVWADFNDFDADYRLRTTLRYSPEWPAEGDWVLLDDGEGNTVGGIVERIDGVSVEVQAVMETWAVEPLSFATTLISPVFSGVLVQPKRVVA